MMSELSLNSYILKLISDFKFSSNKKYKLLIVWGLLGDFDTFEYAINLKKITQNKNINLNFDTYAIAIGEELGKQKFCEYTGFLSQNLKLVSDNNIHNKIGASKGLDIGLGGWINMLLMLSGVNSPKTIQEVLRGYTGDKNSPQIFKDEDQINIINKIKFSGKLFKKTCGDGYLRPFELATFRLCNMLEIIKYWNNYILNTKYLAQRGATFILDSNDKIIYQYFPQSILSYSERMSSPLGFLSDLID